MTSRRPSLAKQRRLTARPRARSRQRMQMAGDLAVARTRGRLVAEGQRPERQHLGKAAADAVGRIGIVVAGDPDPVATALQR